MRDLKEIIADNNRAVERFKLKKKLENNHNRACSFQGDAASGVILRSAKKRNTAFLPGGRAASEFITRWVGAKDQAARNELVESYFA